MRMNTDELHCPDIVNREDMMLQGVGSDSPLLHQRLKGKQLICVINLQTGCANYHWYDEYSICFHQLS
jgi:hypothetical protein